MLMLSQVLALAGMKKSDFDTRRARGLLGFFPLDLIGSHVDERDPRPAARAKYTIGDAVALDLFQQAAARRLPNDVIDAMIRDAAGHFAAALGRDEKADLFLACALNVELNPSGDIHGRAHARGIKTARELLPWIERQAPHKSGRGDDASQVVLLNFSAAHRRVLARRDELFNGAPAE
jgi:hypothetical protein